MIFNNKNNEIFTVNSIYIINNRMQPFYFFEKFWEK